MSFVRDFPSDLRALRSTAGRVPARVLMLVVALGTVIGCGRSDAPELGDVEGRVIMDGQPVEGALVTFQPQGGVGTYSAAYTDQDGNYKLVYSRTRTGAMVGTHEVYISTLKESEDLQGRPIRNPETIPPRYNVDTELVREVEPGSNTIDFELESGGFEPTFRVRRR